MHIELYSTQDVSKGITCSIPYCSGVAQRSLFTVFDRHCSVFYDFKRYCNLNHINSDMC